MLSLTRDMLLLTREEERIAEARKFGREEAAAKYAEKMRNVLNRLMAKGFTREEAVAILGENI